MKLRVGNWLVNKRSGPSSTANVGAYGLLVKADPSTVYQVPFVAQKHINMCGEACVVMLQKFKGAPVSINMNVNPRGLSEGGDGVGELANQHGLRNHYFQGDTNNLTSKKIADALDNYGPLICAGEYARFIGKRFGHFIVVTGIHGNLVFINDPWHGSSRAKPVDRFAPKLNDTWFANIN